MFLKITVISAVGLGVISLGVGAASGYISPWIGRFNDFMLSWIQHAKIFIVMYGLISMYFAGVLVHLILVTTPSVCLMSVVAVSTTIENLTQLVRAKIKSAPVGSGKGTTSSKASFKGSLDQSLPFQRNDANVMSWWDYGYQIMAMGDKTMIVDNNTWNNTHIATIGHAMSSYEDEAYENMRSLDANYVLVVFGGVTGYSSDDINK